MARALGGKADEDRLIGLVTAIEAQKSKADEATLIVQLRSLPSDDIARLAGMKVRGVNEGRLTVLGHLCVKKPCPERLLEILLTINNVNILEEFDGHSIPLLHLAAFACNDAGVRVLCSCEGINVCSRITSPNLSALHIDGRPEGQELWGDELLRRAFESQSPNSNLNANDNFTALHCAAWQGHSVIVATLAKKISSDPRATSTLNALDKFSMSALHYAVMRGDAAMVEDLLSISMVRGNNGQERDYRTPLETASLLATREHLKGLDINTQGRENVPEYKAIINLLSEQPDVKAFTEKLHRDRQLLVDSANASLVVATLIASITFAGCLQPPLGYTPDYETRYLIRDAAAPPDTYRAYISTGITAVRLFWGWNTAAFYLATAAMLTALCVMLPGTEKLEADVRRMRTIHWWTIYLLLNCIYTVVAAFVSAGFADLAPGDRNLMVVPTAIYGVVVVASMYYFNRRLFELKTSKR